MLESILRNSISQGFMRVDGMINQTVNSLISRTLAMNIGKDWKTKVRELVNGLANLEA